MRRAEPSRSRGLLSTMRNAREVNAEPLSVPTVSVLGRM